MSHAGDEEKKDDAVSFFANARKAFFGGISAAIAGAATAFIPLALDSNISVADLTATGIAALIGFVGVWAVVYQTPNDEN